MGAIANIARSRIGIATYLAPDGSLIDAESVGGLADMLNQCIAAREVRLVVDLNKVTLINSAALELMFNVQEQISRLGGELTLTQANAVVRDVLILTGLANRIQLIDDGISQPPASTVRPLHPNRSLRLGERLIERGLVTENDIGEAVKLQSRTGRRLGHILVDLGKLEESDLLSALSEQLSLPFVRLRTGLFDPESVAILDRVIALRHRVVPLFTLHGTLYLATADPQDIPSLDLVQEHTGMKLQPVLATGSEITSTINAAHGTDHDLAEYIGGLDSDSELELIEHKEADDSVTIDEIASGSPVINLINGLIQRAVRDGVSDIHIEPLRNRCQVRFRIDGLLYPTMSPPSEIHPALVSRLKVMANLDIAERRLPQDGRIQVYTHGRTIDLRFSSLPGLFGEKVVLRVLDKTESVTNIEKLGMSEENLKAFKGLLLRSHGLVLVTGPTGSGKTTTLYAALSHLNTTEKSIVTIEDPVEYQLDLINQNQVRENVGLGFAKVLKHILRQDPDIIMVGEIREHETAEIAVQAALTGHLVLSTLHTNDSAGAITRMLDMGVEPFLLSSALIGVVAQRLVRTICPECKTIYTATPGSLARFGQDKKGVQLARGRGCPSCYDSGYKGRMAIHELLKPNDETQRLMLNSPSRNALQQHQHERGTVDMESDGFHHVLRQETTIEEVQRVVNA